MFGRFQGCSLDHSEYSQSVAYELVELSTGNLVGVYSTQEAALRDVAEAIHRGGVEGIATLALTVEDPSGATDGSIIAEGKALAALVLNSPGSAAA
jgi:hypothetical protein